MNKKVVLDSNTIVSSLLMPHSIPRKAFDKVYFVTEILMSKVCLDELTEVLQRPKFDKYITKEERLLFLNTFAQKVSIIDVSITITDSRDAKDNKFLELAADGNASCIVSGDQDLLVLHPWQNIPILSPKDFLDFEF